MKISHVERNNNSLVTFTNEIGFSLTLSDFGAGLYEMRWNGEPLTIAEKDPDQYLYSTGYFGKTVGRIAGRIKKGLLPFNGKTYQLGINDGANCLHSGPTGLSFVTWRRDVVTNDGETYCDYYYFSPEGEGGFPGEVTFRVRYHLFENEPKVEILYQSLSPIETPINLTTHTYFNLGGSPTILDHVLWIKSEENEFYDKEMIPTGIKKSPECLDFSKPRKIGAFIKDPLIYKTTNKGYDHSYLLLPHTLEEPVLTLSGNGLRMELRTDLPCLQVYSDNYPREHTLLTNGNIEQTNASVAIEPVEIPGDFAKMSVGPNEFKRNTIIYSFSKEEEP